MVFTSTATPSLRLHVQDLPESIDILSHGGVYALVVDTPPARFPLLTASLSGALDQGLLINLLLATPPQPWLERLAQLGLSATEDAVQTGRLQVFQQQTDFTKKIFRHGTPFLCRSLSISVCRVTASWWWTRRMICSACTTWAWPQVRLRC